MRFSTVTFVLALATLGLGLGLIVADKSTCRLALFAFSAFGWGWSFSTVLAGLCFFLFRSTASEFRPRVTNLPTQENHTGGFSFLCSLVPIFVSSVFFLLWYFAQELFVSVTSFDASFFGIFFAGGIFAFFRVAFTGNNRDEENAVVKS